MTRQPVSSRDVLLSLWRITVNSRLALDIWRVAVASGLVYLSVLLARKDPFWINTIPAQSTWGGLPLVVATHPLYYVVGAVPAAYLAFALIRSLREFGRSSMQSTVKQ